MDIDTQTEPNLCLPILSLLQPVQDNEANDDQKGPLAINREENEDQFVCRLTMDIATKQWTVEPGIKLDDAIIKDTFKLANPDEPYWRQRNVNPEDDSKKTQKQLRAERKQREAERARRDAERAKKRLEAKRAMENTGAPEEKQDDVTSTPNE